jgi:hypothetical protein
MGTCYWNAKKLSHNFFCPPKKNTHKKLPANFQGNVEVGSQKNCWQVAWHGRKRVALMSLNFYVLALDLWPCKLQFSVTVISSWQVSFC